MPRPTSAHCAYHSAPGNISGTHLNPALLDLLPNSVKRDDTLSIYGIGRQTVYFKEAYVVIHITTVRFANLKLHFILHMPLWLRYAITTDQYLRLASA